ncbi:PREDICTED: CCAAT/enhancer-binding protein gamma-like [Amphimedon queenslandica]|uniref:BZIP domain-containing protein n=1 Tax=Amphimedon queenslandica TaxID=400682 RepID=A0A1X7VVH1_AMPQE|nr:PREDICTED: CCAAT/enhancer-binding protein gamma-like [Amphimedon queenslandica]|eukprot:XP_003382514.1 PREDICTED: CCAAT/enhancer-binding protein gamma-like [Amphimedon queenslandica]
MADKDSLYSIEQYLGLAASAKATSGNLYPFGQAPPSSVHLGFQLEEESVDFSELVKACEQKDYYSQTTNDYYSSGYWYQQKPPGMPIRSEEETSTLVGVGTTSNPHDVTNVSANPTLPPVASSLSAPSPPPTVQDTAARTRQTTKKQKINDKCTDDYKDKRHRNNIAVRKSRSKFRKRVLETEKRVQELEENNAKLKNYVALLQKELAVLKGLFSSASNASGDERYS